VSTIVGSCEKARQRSKCFDLHGAQPVEEEEEGEKFHAIDTTFLDQLVARALPFWANLTAVCVTFAPLVSPTTVDWRESLEKVPKSGSLNQMTRRRQIFLWTKTIGP